MSPIHAPATSDFAARLSAEIEAVQTFLLTLQSEHNALTEGNIDKLSEYSRLKSDQLVRLSQLSTANFLAQRNAGAAAHDLAKTIREMDPDGRHGLTEKWEKLLNLAKQAQYQNQLNGAMIETQMKHNQQALAILQEAAKQSSLYGPDGHSRALGSGRQLGKI